MKTARIGVLACAVALMMAGAPVLSGCGSSNGGTFIDNDGFPIGGGSHITRANAASFSQDAIVLALRKASSPWISANDAQIFDADLRKIRSQVPAVNDVRARLEYDPRTLIVSVDASTPWRAAWNGGAVLTGDTAVDALLRQYNAVSVKPLVTGVGGETFYTITFDQPLNIVNLKDAIKAASTHFVTAETNGIVGGGDNIVFATVGDGKKYTFSRGSGDCPAGCINNHFWDVTIAKNGTVSVQERDT